MIELNVVSKNLDKLIRKMRKREIRENRGNNVKDSADTYKNGTGKPFSFKNRKI